MERKTLIADVIFVISSLNSGREVHVCPYLSLLACDITDPEIK
jgi:hypothetical protein